MKTVKQLNKIENKYKLFVAKRILHVVAGRKHNAIMAFEARF